MAEQTIGHVVDELATTYREEWVQIAPGMYARWGVTLAVDPDKPANWTVIDEAQWSKDMRGES